MSENAVAAASSREEAVIVPLRSDPPWLRLGLVVVTVLSVGLFMLYFRLISAPRPPIGLAVIPGMALATFAGAYLAWWGRRHGGTLQLHGGPTRLTLRDADRREELVDRASPFGAMIVTDKSSGTRVLLLSQNGEPVTILDLRRAAPPGGSWAKRSVEIDLSTVALSPATANVLTVSIARTIDPVLDALALDLTAASPLLSYPLPSGEVLLVSRDEIRLGSRVVPIGPETQSRRIAVQSPAGEVVALSLVAGTTTLLFACQDPAEVFDPSSASEAPDGYLPALVFAVIAALFGVEGSALSTASKPYRG